MKIDGAELVSGTKLLFKAELPWYKKILQRLKIRKYENGIYEVKPSLSSDAAIKEYVDFMTKESIAEAEIFKVIFDLLQQFNPEIPERDRVFMAHYLRIGILTKGYYIKGDECKVKQL